MLKYNAITDVPGILVGYFANRATGTTVVLVEGEGAVGGVSVVGAAPGTRETDALRPENLVVRVNAVVLSGGSAYGLEAAAGVMRYLEDRKRGFPINQEHVVPIVPAAVLFDLGRGGNWQERPTAEFGYRACLAATSGTVAQGNVGAGTGAVAGGLKGGIGTASIFLEGGLIVGAIVAVNSYGSPIDPRTGFPYARYLEVEGEFGLEGAKPRVPQRAHRENLGPLRNTTIGVVATNARLSKAQATKVAQMAQDGIARAIRPAHTMFDGDTIFALATGEVEAALTGGPFGSEEEMKVNLIGTAASDVVARAIVHAVLSAESALGFPGYRELYLKRKQPIKSETSNSSFLRRSDSKNSQEGKTNDG